MEKVFLLQGKPRLDFSDDAQPRSPRHHCYAIHSKFARRRETLKQHHSWFVQKTVGVALMSLGSRKDVFNRVREKDMSDDKVVEHAKSVPGNSGGESGA